MSSLSPVHTVGDQIVEVLRLHWRMGKKAARARTVDLLRQVEIPNPERAVDRYTFEFSGGMRQRAMIAMALACNPSLLIADEPTTALDVTTQAEILDLIKRLQAEHGMAVMFITHDMGVVAEIADDVLVMYHGKVMESGPVETIFHAPQDAYTQMLIGSVLKLEEKAEIRRQRPPIAAEQPAVIEVEQPENALRPRRKRRRRRSTTCRSRSKPSETLGDRRRVRLGQDHARPLPAARLDPTAGRIDYRRRGRQRGRSRDRRQADAEDLPARDPHDLPGPVLLAQSAHDGGADHRRAAAGERHRQGRRARRPRRRADAPGRARAGLARALSARVLRRPAPAHRHRARGRARAAPDRRRRADLGARRVAARADARPDDPTCRTSSASPTS